MLYTNDIALFGTISQAALDGAEIIAMGPYGCGYVFTVLRKDGVAYRRVDESGLGREMDAAAIRRFYGPLSEESVSSAQNRRQD